MFPWDASGCGETWISSSAEMRNARVKVLEEPQWRPSTPLRLPLELKHHLSKEPLSTSLPGLLDEKQLLTTLTSCNSPLMGINDSPRCSRTRFVGSPLEENEVPSDDLVVAEAPQLHSMLSRSASPSYFESEHAYLHPSLSRNVLSDLPYALNVDACSNQALVGGHAIALAGMMNCHEGVTGKLSTDDLQLPLPSIAQAGDFANYFSPGNGGSSIFPKSISSRKLEAIRDKPRIGAINPINISEASQMEDRGRRGPFERLDLDGSTYNVELATNISSTFSTGILFESDADFQHGILDGPCNFKYSNLLLEALDQNVPKKSCETASCHANNTSFKKQRSLRPFSPIGPHIQPGQRRHISPRCSHSDAFAPAASTFPGSPCLDFVKESNSNMAVPGETSTDLISDVPSTMKHVQNSGSDEMVEHLTVDGSEEDLYHVFKDEPEQIRGCSIGDAGVRSGDKTPITGTGLGKTKGSKGPPAKNLMAERRRRKKLNDRLYMLRSVVPRISKMDRASILGDAIEYLKELLTQINDLHAEIETPLNMPVTTHDPKQIMDANPDSAFCATEKPTLVLQPNFQEQASIAKVEVKSEPNNIMNIHMFCARRPGLVLSTMKVLDGLGLDVQQAVISCFDGFALDVFRAEQAEASTVGAEDVKALLLNIACCQA